MPKSKSHNPGAEAPSVSLLPPFANPLPGTTSLSAVLDNANEAICSVDREGRLITFNSVLRDIFRNIYHVEIAVGMDLREVVFEEERVFWESNYQRLFSAGERVSIIRDYPAEYGGQTIEYSLNPIFESDTVVAAAVFGRDITSERKALAQIQFHANILSQTGDLIMAVDEQGVITYWNRAAEERTGIPAEKAIGERGRDLLPEWTPEEGYEQIDESLAQTGSWKGIFRLRTPDGAERALLTSIYVLREDGREIGKLSISSEITERERMEKALARSEAQYQKLFEESPLPMWIFDTTTFRFLQVNRAACELYGYSKEEFSRLALPDIRLPQDREEFLNKLVSRIQDAADEGAVSVRHTKKNGEQIEVQVFHHLIQYDGKPARFALIEDITRRAQVERELQVANERYRLASEAITGVIFDMDVKSGFSQRSSGLKTLLGFDPDESPEISTVAWWHSRIHPEDVERVRSMRIHPEEKVYEAEYRMLHRQGHTIYIWERGVIVRNDAGEIIRIVGSTQDVTEAVQSRNELEKANERFQLASEALTSVIYDLDIATGYTKRSKGLKRLLGFDPNDPEVQSLDWWESRIHPDDLPSVHSKFQNALKYESSCEAEYRMLHKDGHFIYVWDRGAIARNAQGRAIRFVGSTQDVTEQVRTKKQLEEANERYRLASKAVTSVIYDWNPATGDCIISPGMKELLGYDPDSLPEIHRSEWWTNTIHPDDREAVARVVWAAVADKDGYEVDFRMRHLDGHYVFVWDRGVIKRDASGKAVRVIGSVQDVTEELKMRYELELANERFRLATEAVTAVIYDWNVSTGKCFVSPGLMSLLGFDPRNDKGTDTIDWWIGRIHPEDRTGALAVIRPALETSDSYAAEYRMQHRDGQYVYVWDRGSIHRNAYGRAVRVVGSTQDITARKRMEAQLEQERNLALLAKERAEEMTRLKSSFLANMSHEIRTPMTAILGFAELLNERLADSDLAEHAATIESSAKRLLVTINGILDLAQVESRNIKLQPVVTCVNAEMKRVTSLLEPLASQKNIELHFLPSPKPFDTFLDPKQLDHVVTNLVGNAIKFTDKGGVTVSIAGPFDREKPSTLAKGVASYRIGKVMRGDHFCILVEDTGTGIAAENLPLVFEEFKQESTGYQRSHEGTGLGLTISSRLVEAMGGSIEVRSARGVGSTFIVRLPIGDVPLSVDNDTPKKKIVLVEDSMETVKLVTAVLGERYELVHARNIAEARDVFKSEVPDLIFMDINLGEFTTGLDLATELRRRKAFKDVPIVAVTAYAMETDREMAMEAGCTDYLSKPFTRAELVEMVHQYLPARPREKAIAGKN